MSNTDKRTEQQIAMQEGLANVLNWHKTHDSISFIEKDVIEKAFQILLKSNSLLS